LKFHSDPSGSIGLGPPTFVWAYLRRSRGSELDLRQILAITKRNKWITELNQAQNMGDQGLESEASIDRLTLINLNGDNAPLKAGKYEHA